jgi:anti-anti-sigma factor
VLHAVIALATPPDEGRTMDIETRIDRRQVTVRIRGRLLAGEDCDRLQTAIVRLLEDGHRQFVVDFAEVGQIDSFGLGSLVRAVASIHGAGGSIRLEGARSPMGELISMTNVLDLFDRKPKRGWTNPYVWVGVLASLALILWMLVHIRP